jgi:succinoglycan biosynthesis transport protein ExoP
MADKKHELHLRDFLRVLQKRRKPFWGFFFAVVILVLLVTFSLTPQYEGTTKLMIEKVEGGELTGTYRGKSVDPEFYETQFQLLKSRAVARRVVDTLDLVENYDAFIGKTRGSLPPVRVLLPRVKDFIKSVRSLVFPRKNQEASEEELVSRKEKLAETITEELTVRPVEGSRIINLSYFSPNPELAAMIANATARAYIEETLEMKLDATRRSLQWMTKKAEAEAIKLRKAEEDLQSYMKENNIVTIEDRMTGTPEKLSEINIELVRAESRRKELEALYRQVRSAGNNYRAAETISAISSDPALREIRAAIVETEKSLMEMGNKFGPKHPVMQKTRGDLRVLENKRIQEIQRIAQSIKNEYELALAHERNLRSLLEGTKTEALLLNEKFIQYGALKRVVDTNRQMYDALMLKLKEQSITQETQPINLWIVEKATVPLNPSKPWVAANLLMGLLIGALGGTALAFFLDYLDNTIKDPEEAEEAFGVPVLGTIQLWKKAAEDLDNIVLKEPHSPLVESYRSLRTAIQLSFPENPPKKILVTSSSMGEGKTTTSLNLALALAQSDSKVLLIECDLRKPRFHKVFKISNTKGLSNYLAGATDGQIIQKGPVPRLALIPSGPIPPNPSELLASNRMKNLIDSLSREFDFIICDSPPLLPVADTRLLGRLVDGVILVSKAGQTTYDLARRSLKMLNDIGARVLGLVINAHDVKKSGYYHQGYYDYYESSQAQAETNKGSG